MDSYYVVMTIVCIIFFLYTLAKLKTHPYDQTKYILDAGNVSLLILICQVVLTIVVIVMSYRAIVADWRTIDGNYFALKFFFWIPLLLSQAFSMPKEYHLTEEGVVCINWFGKSSGLKKWQDLGSVEKKRGFINMYGRIKIFQQIRGKVYLKEDEILTYIREKIHG